MKLSLMPLFKPTYYFVLVIYPHNLRLRVERYMYLKNGKFKVQHNLDSGCLLTWYQALKWQLKFYFCNFFKKSHQKYFDYKTIIHGSIFMQKINNTNGKNS